MLDTNLSGSQSLEFTPHCHIASMVVYCHSQHQSALVDTCESMIDSKVYKDERDTAFVLVVERSSEGRLRKTIDNINTLTGVVNVNLVYHHCDTDTALSENISS